MFKRVLFHKLEKFTVQTLGPTIRKWGQQIYKTGTEFTGDDQPHDELVKSLRCVPISNKVFPKLLSADWIAPNATVIGDVEFGEGSSLWHTAVVRGDTAKVSVGKNSIVQDRVLIKSSGKDDSEVKIGNNVFVAPNWHIDAWTLDDYSYIGMGATIHKGAYVEPYAVVAAGAVIQEGATVPSGQVWAGNPARYLRDVTQEEKHQISEYLIEQQQLSQIYWEETEKTYRDICNSEENMAFETNMKITDKVQSILSKMGMPLTMEDMEYLEHRALSQYKMDIVDQSVGDPGLKEDHEEMTWNPYEQDLTKFPEIFKMYGENREKYEEVKAKFDNEKKGQQMGDHPMNAQYPRDMGPWSKKYNEMMER